MQGFTIIDLIILIVYLAAVLFAAKGRPGNFG